MTENFQSIPWLNGNATEVRTGFEPLFFHIQAEFQWQRPFSEGCGGWISEKLKKNLSQSYGRWIVGFHEPMTSAFFALKKGAGIGGMNMSKEQTAKKERFLREVERQLLRKGLDSEMMEDGILNVKWHGQLLCDVDGDGMVCFPSKTVRGVDADASLQTVIQIASQVREYMPIFARAPALKAIGLEGSYKILADFGDAVLAGRLGKKGANFVTWEWDFDRNGVHMGHYFIEDYAGAKRDFAARSRLIEPQRLFSDKELGVIRNACEFALADDATLTYGDETRLRSIQEQIEILLPRNQEQEQEQEQRSEMEQTM